MPSKRIRMFNYSNSPNDNTKSIMINVWFLMLLFFFTLHLITPIDALPASLTDLITFPMLRFKIFFYTLFFLTMTSCSSSEKMMYTNLDTTGDLFLSRYTTLIPTLGPCGFSRSQDSYSIKTPRTIGRIEASELHIMDFNQDTIKYHYSGHIEFLKDNLVYVELFKEINGTRIKLKINGKSKIKIEANRIGNKKV